MSRMGESGPNSETPSQAPNFNTCWDDFRKLKLNMQVVEAARQPDELGDLLFDAFQDDWASKPENRIKLAKMKKDPAHALFRKHYESTSMTDYAWEQILRRLFYGKQ